MSTRLLSSLALVVTLLPALTNAADKPDPTAWRDTVRDVYINGTLDRPAQVLVADAPRRFAILSSTLDHAVVYDTESKAAWKTAKNAFILTPDRLKAVASIKPSRRKSTLSSTVEGVHSAKVGHDLIVMAPHQSTAGPMAVDELAKDFPAWGASSLAYESKPGARSTLAAVTEPATVKVFFATWCGDSKYYVPKVIESIRESANSNLKVELIGVGPDFHSPLDAVQENRIINVPTFIVERNGLELGRITETPALETVEDDLAAILTGTLPRHEGRWERDAKIASGIYEITEAGVASGTEEWTIYKTPAGGRLLHSVVSGIGSEREVWQTYDENGHTTFVEVTVRSENGARRTRYRKGTGTMSAHSRGNDSGIIDQLVAIPDACGFDAGTAAGAASGCPVEGTQVATRYCISDDEITGRLETIKFIAGANSSVQIGAQRLDARHIETLGRASDAEMLVEQTLKIPLEIAGNDGRNAKLVTLNRY